MHVIDAQEARAGDTVSVESHRIHGGRRTGTIVEVLGTPGHRYFRVRWQDGRESVFHPGPDAVVEASGKRPRRTAAARARSAARAAQKPASGREGRARKRVPGMRASVGDRLVIKSHSLGRPVRDAEILEVLGKDGGPPYRVRWSDSGRESVLYPGPDAAVEHIRRRRRSRGAGS